MRMSDVVRIVANQERRFKTAHVWDCVFLTYVGNRHTPVMGGGPFGNGNYPSGGVGSSGERCSA